MPINVPDRLPAIDVLRQENIFVMTESTAIHQDIRPLRIAVLNLMPIKQTTETQIIRMLSNSPLQIELELVHIASHISKNTPQEHLKTFYKDYREIMQHKYDGFIITGAPIEHLEFEEVDYWKNIQEIMDWTVHNVTSTLFICWAAQAGLYHFYGIPKYKLPAKMFGVFEHVVTDPMLPLVRGFDDVFMAPHSRHTEVRREDIEKIPELQIVAYSREAGVHIVMDRDGRKIFVTGHFEYDPHTLHQEYVRDKNKGMDIDIPQNYFLNDDPSQRPVVTWRSHANLFFSNWLNYYVYQSTPYNIDSIQ
ncbi:MAG TPA: homoserine O-succinyltransferase [Bacteroidales bacterium]|nr:homoserine O-succinyltransferase [Bacteroidales bacterium]HPO64836.1 homoserine O-succinyltransferase [Bacteroidales bacterium]